MSDRPTSVPTVLRFLAGQVEWLAHRPEAEVAFDELHHAAHVVREAIDTASPRVFLGPCDVCGRDMHAPPQADEVECRPCALVYPVAGRREAMLASVEDRLHGAADIASYLTTYGEPIDAARIRQWKRRGRIEARAEDARGNPLFRIGDVLDLLRRDDTRAMEAV